MLSSFLDFIALGKKLWFEGKRCGGEGAGGRSDSTFSASAGGKCVNTTKVHVKFHVCKVCSHMPLASYQVLFPISDDHPILNLNIGFCIQSKLLLEKSTESTVVFFFTCIYNLQLERKTKLIFVDNTYKELETEALDKYGEPITCSNAIKDVLKMTQVNKYKTIIFN